MPNRLINGEWVGYTEIPEISKENLVAIHKMFEDIKKTGRQMANDEWNLLQLTNYYYKYFAIPPEYFEK